jgi:hypothetical protein
LASHLIEAARHGGLALNIPPSPGVLSMARAVRALLERVALDAANRAKFTTPAEAVRQAMGGVS